jgi:hypothetical protein
MRSCRNWGWVALSALCLAGAAGCGTPGAPQPPSLNLPEPVTDLSADRAGDQVTLTWTMPKRNTDKLRIKDNVGVRVCRREIAGGPCVDAGPAFELAPGSDGMFTESLPAALASGNPRVVDYFVELRNRKGRSAGLSNAVPVPAGAPPAAISGLKAEVQKDGVILSWAPDSENAAVRLQRKLLTPLPAKPKEGLTTPPPEPVEQDLLIEDTQQGRALDKSVRFGETYEYRAQRVARVTAEGKTFELNGTFSAPVRIDVKNVFPPAVPTGLVAVSTLGGNGAETAIDLSWQPDSEADLAGYVVYRREGNQTWDRISPSEPVVGPAFHDPHVQSGHTYRYAVSAVDQDGHESARSDEAQETVPSQ